MKLKFTITVNLEPIAPPLRLLRDRVLRPVGARLVRVVIANFIHPVFDKASVHLRLARTLIWLERP